jgi:peptide/nickel transport system substrate-binding protein
MADSSRRGGTLVIAAPSDLRELNSLVTTDSYTSQLLVHALFVPLVRLTPELGFEPGLARSWQWQGDTAVVFQLRGDVYWSDGRPTTAHDVAFTFQQLKDPATGFPDADYFRHWTGAQVIDSATIRFTLERHPEALLGWAFLGIMPAHALDSIPAERLAQAEFNRQPITNGPFRFVSGAANDRYVLEANPRFPAELGGPPRLERVVWRVLPENAAQVAEIETGNAHLILSPRADRLAELDAKPDLRALIRPSRRFIFIGWNGRRAPLNDARVRRALAMALDRWEMLQVLRGGHGEIAVGPIGSFHWAFDRNLQPLPFDTLAARKLLAEAGLRDTDRDGVVEGPNGKAFQIELKIAANNAFNGDVAEMIRADLAAVGVRVVTRPVEFATLISDISSAERQFDAVLMGWEADFRIGMRDLFHSAALGGDFQLASYRNPEVDHILDETAQLLDRDEALLQWHRLQQILRDEQPWTVLWYAPELYVVKESVQGVTMDIRGAFVSLPRWWIAESAVAGL